MTQEDKVRNAVRVASELVDVARHPEPFGYQMWLSVFHAMLIEDLPKGNYTAEHFGLPGQQNTLPS